MNRLIPLFQIIVFSLIVSLVQAQDRSPLWTATTESELTNISDRQIIPEKYKVFEIDQNQLLSVLNNAAKDSPYGVATPFDKITFPMPDGTTQQFSFIEAPIMEEAFSDKFPEIRTYRGQGVTDPTASVRFDFTPDGFHAMILSASGTVFIDPYSKSHTGHVISYYKHDFKPQPGERIEEPIDIEEFLDPNDLQIESEDNEGDPPAPSGSQLRTYRIAIACTGEYATFHGGTIPSVLSAMATTMNRVNGIYEREVAIRMIIIGNNDQIVYLNPNTDPYTEGDPGAMIQENQANINSVIGPGNYDIGHVFSTQGGGLAGLRVPCKNNQKSRGVTGINSPVGDPFDVDYVCHEIGHQFGATHTFNGSTGSCTFNISTGTAYEPGSGTTIMAYSGICAPQNITNAAGAYFHTASFDQIVNYSTLQQGNSCPVVTNTGNSAPVINAGTGGYTIPQQTPFILKGSATDPDGDALTYCWEEFDLGPQGAPNSPSGNAPLFRSFDPVQTEERIFPKISDIITGFQTMGEILPDYTRTLSFRLTARDNRSGGGGVDYDVITFNVSSAAGPFLVTSPNTDVTWAVGATETVTWDVANTNQSPVNCSTVNILLSVNSGVSFPITLATNVPNTGSYDIVVPDQVTNSARVKVEAADNIFFDISDENFDIIKPSIDGQVASILNPVSQSFVFQPQTIKCLVKNNGQNSFSFYDVGYTINGGTAVIENDPTNISAGDSSEYTFTQTWEPVDQGPVELCLFTQVINDGLPENDTTCITLTSIVGVDELSPSATLVTNVYPVPASDEVNMVVTPLSNQLQVKIFDLYGKLIRQEQFSLTAGNESLIRLNTSEMARGVYLYQVESGSAQSKGRIVLIE